jgi:sigma-B regulation protein RsbU (phosphoserine phosphatase)
VLLESLRREYRRHRMARFAVWIFAYGLALWIMGRIGGVPGFLWVLFWITAIPTAVYYFFRLLGFFKQRLLWRLRRRLVVAYVFIAVVPIALIVLLVGLGVYITNGQFASFLVASKLRNRVEVLHHLNRMIAHQAGHLKPTTPEALLDELQSVFIADLHDNAANYPGLTITLRLADLTRTANLAGGAQPQPVSIPSWLKNDEFSGVVEDEGHLALRAVDRHRTKVGELIVVLSQPFTAELLDQLAEGIGPIGLLEPREISPQERKQVPQSGFNVTSNTQQAPRLVISSEHGEAVEEAGIKSKLAQIPAPAFSFDYIVYSGATLDPILWGGDEQKQAPQAGFFYVTSRIVTLDRQLLSTLGQFSGIYWVAFAAVGVIFLIIELVAVVIGVQLTRSITKTVDKLHEGTERVKVGDFAYRIALPARDQLSSLGEAFDGMTASVERLLRESMEKTRMEGELEIAREVQNQLFPQNAPEVPGLRLHGECKPARGVSGDYYDFLRLDETRIGLVVGDISGKGISAALLMASIQSALHAQFFDGHAPQGLADASVMSSADVVARLNRQLYASTPTEKYATFFYAIYDAPTRRLIYTNAGHPPPFYFHRGKVERSRHL